MGSLAWAFVADTKFIKRVFPTPPWMPAAFQKKEFLNPINGKREVSTRWTFKNAKFKRVDVEEFPEKFFPDEFVEKLDRHVSGSKMDGTLLSAIATWNKKRQRRKDFKPLPNIGDKAFPTMLLPQDESGALMKFPPAFSVGALEDLSENHPTKRGRELFELLLELKEQQKSRENLYLWVAY